MPRRRLEGYTEAVRDDSPQSPPPPRKSQQDRFDRWAERNSDIISGLDLYRTNGHVYPFPFLDDMLGLLGKHCVPTQPQQEALDRSLSVFRSQLTMGEPIDPDKCPPKHDEWLWEMALEYKSQGEHYGHSCPSARLIYARIRQSVERYLGQHPEYARESQTATPGEPVWHAVLPRMVRYFWDEVMEPDYPQTALNEFCGPDIWDHCWFVAYEKVLHTYGTKRKTKVTTRVVTPEERARAIQQRRELRAHHDRRMFG